MNTNVIGLDISKNVFHLYSQTDNGTVVKKKLKRAEIAGLYRQHAGQFDRHGSLRRCALLGP